jgi:hypothetical protein
MTWNLRVVRTLDEDLLEKVLEIREVYYDDNGDVMGHCIAAMAGDDIEDLKTYLEWALDSLKKPILEFTDDDVSE